MLYLPSCREPVSANAHALLSCDGAACRPLVSQADLLKVLRHPYILHCHEAFKEGQFLCIVTELCDQGDLSQRLEETKAAEKQIPVEQVCVLRATCTLLPWRPSLLVGNGGWCDGYAGYAA